ncbi:cytochrome c biogenesis protein CcsA [Anaeromyxobacter paludicola]|uniref:Cytochrome c assembly protein n=1 Tax=Anaeromyxobacter paludicola TaxID=2918171 RepID=A0ABM7X693_9BACT|nr:cytochrome c biogenesis protein CcsA [Anaeromyxobacter paludicola]BDG07330.1 hypothetical protein AMPC_04430 [Anaeromyxobacter paludicola]
MKKLVEALASLKLAVVLLVLLLLGLSAGTIVESSRGAEVAGKLVYYSWWFLGLEVVFLVNVACSIVHLYPWGKPRIGFLVTHGAMVVILAGASASYFLKQEGQLMLWEGETGNQLVAREADGGAAVTLPFAVQLERFRIDHYPGTMRPSNFRSDVRIIDSTAGDPFPAAIWMNHPFDHRGWRFFQSSYQQQGGRSATVLSVSKDPGEPIVFVGYGLLVLGMCLVLGTRISQARAKKKALEALGALAALALLGVALPAHAADPGLEQLRRLPVQHDGRVMPLDTLAREQVVAVTGERAFQGSDPVQTVVSWWAEPQAAAQAPVVKLGHPDLAAAVGAPGMTHASFAQIVNSQAAMQLLDQAREAAASGRPRQGVLSAAEKLEERLVAMQAILQREVIRPVPPPGDVTQRWGVPRVGGAAELTALAAGPRLQGWPSAAEIDREITYNQVRPTRVAWIVLVLALLVSIYAWSGRSKLLDGIALAGLVAGFAVMTWGIGTRWAIAGRIPASNMYESLLFLAWGVGLFAVVAFALMRNRLVVLNANAMAALTMLLTDLLPIDGFVHPVPPVLSGTPWLAIHVPIIMVSYSVLALGVVIAHMQVGFTIFSPRRAELIERMADLLYWYMFVGSILLIAGILTGSIWAASSWGRYWGWDPKEVWSLVAFLAYMAIVHGRFDKLIGNFGVAAISIVAFQTILMTYLGVNFVLTTGMHSYGMGDSPVVTWMIVVALAEIAFLVIGWAAHQRQQKALAAA